MAHIAHVEVLTGKLVTALTTDSIEESTPRFPAFQELALRTLRYHNYPPTDPFQLQRDLQGLIEKFYVHCRDDLAEALQRTLDELDNHHTVNIPQIIHLLVQLSDRPVHQTASSTPADQRSSSLDDGEQDWKELFFEKSLSEEENIWDTNDYGTESSEDGVDNPSVGTDVVLGVPTQTSSCCAIERANVLVDDRHILSLPLPNQLILGFTEIQFWTHPVLVDSRAPMQRIVRITEVQVIREVLFMLAGLPTAIFQDLQQIDLKVYQPVPGYWIAEISSEILYDILDRLADQGSSLHTLRLWVHGKQNTPLLQAFQEQVHTRLLNFQRKLGSIQQTLAVPSDATISLLVVVKELEQPILPLLRLSKLIQQLQREPYAHSFRYLELLFDDTCMLQSAGDETLYNFMATLFLDCFQTYLQPIRNWVEHGEILPSDDFFFISDVQKDIERASVWHCRYKLKKTHGDTLHAPYFLHTASTRVFTSGKSVVLLKMLPFYDDIYLPAIRLPRFDLRSIQASSSELLPFPILFDGAFAVWIRDMHRSASSTLRHHLLQKFGLKDCIEAFTTIYLMTDGAASTTFAEGVFQSQDRGSLSWVDGLTMSELAQNTFGQLEHVDKGRLKVKPVALRRNDMQQARKSVKSLAAVRLFYALPWPARVIITESSLPLYHQIFTFLLQIRRASRNLKGLYLVRKTASFGSGAETTAAYLSLRARLLWFTSTLHSYISDIVLTKNIASMQTELEEAEDVDQMISAHQHFVERITDQSLLGKSLKPLRRSIVMILDLCLRLSDAQSLQQTTQFRQSSFLREKERSDPGFHGRWHLQRDMGFDSSEEGDDFDADLSAIVVDNTGVPYTEQLQNWRTQFDDSAKFITSGLRSVLRVGGEPCWDLLAAKLEAGFGGP